MRLHVHAWGQGPPAVLVHGAVLGGREAWVGQRPLTERWRLLAPDRPGHGSSPDARQDFEAEAELVAEQLMDEPVHLLGFSYGGIVAMLAAARRPDRVRSLTVVEPPAWGLLPDHPLVAERDRQVVELMSRDPDDPRRMLEDFFAAAGVPVPVPDPLPEPLARGASAMSGARPPGEARLPLEEVAAAPYPVLVISGGHDDAFEAVCDEIAQATGAERAVLPGLGHLVPNLGEPFNEVVERHWRAADGA